MTRFILLLLLVYLTDACPVENCDHNFCFNSTCTKCSGSYFLTANQCTQCFLNCQLCHGEQCYTCAHNSCDSCNDNCTCFPQFVYYHCSTCPEGYYKVSRKCYKCHFHKCTCFDKYGCTGCISGYYGTSNMCENRCPSNCATCTCSSECTECISGKYGPQCQSNCSTICDDGTCDKLSGACVNRCATGQYLGQDNACKSCPNRCSACTEYLKCSRCKKPYNWGQICQYDCVGCYEYCNKEHGCISECDSNYYKSYDVVRRGYICSHCPGNCTACTNSTLCNECTTGHWGSYCQYECSGCNGTCNQHYGCSAGCEIGHFVRKIDNGFLCYNCIVNCLICQNDTSCEECNDGYFLTDGRDCIPCLDQCQDKICNRSDGSCIEGCKGNWFGSHCNESCPSNCRECNQICSSCKIGYFGSSCEYACSERCKMANGLQTCYKSNGTCIYGCKPGYWGHFCDLLCEMGCDKSVCNLTTGVCLNGCRGHLFGKHCNKECSSNCIHNVQTNRHCDESSGNCHYGCSIGWYGANCTAKCNSSCKELLCYQQNGLCLLGFSDELSGSCNITELSSVDVKSDGSLAVIVALSIITGIAVLVASLSAGVIIILFKRGRFKLMSRIGKSELKERQAVGESRQENNQYEGLNRSDPTDEAYSTIANEYENYL